MSELIKGLKTIKVNEPKKSESQVMNEEYMSAPRMYVKGKQMLEIKEWEVGDEYHLVVKVKLAEKEENEDGRISGALQVLAYKEIKGKKVVEDMSDDELEDMQAEGLSS